MGEWIKLTAADGFTLDAWRSEPSGTPKGGVVVLQEIFGVNDHIRRVADGFAAEGYLAIAPALFDRAQPRVELGYSPEDGKQGMEIRARTTMDGALADVQAAVKAASEAGKVGVVGYCWGGSLAFMAAARVSDVSAAVGYYGGLIASNLNQIPKVPTILHFGEKDKHIPLTDVEKIQQAFPQMSIFVYPADHGFNCDARASYDKPSADLARARTLEFFADKLR
ncbi:carboxymethylenebutenolidase [Alsobacter soli]|uniref:Carboxymethylenebutenolidase n=1 Tax=Alsobacter soli TaxID=2109933 RepID=A0A2T1HQM4_9HYPH|nr:dienelactone hydrolase family protein [Alsobacter soli]PSC03953.1 carboxymethylenebutenolidase [Alsobacter soli]